MWMVSVELCSYDKLIASNSGEPPNAETVGKFNSSFTRTGP